jgi:hypothetical protein
MVNLICTLEDGGAEVTVSWPSDDVAYCGEKIKDRACDAESISPDASPTDKLKIKFGEVKIEGYINDIGAPYGK